MLEGKELFAGLTVLVEGALVYEDTLVFSDVHLGLERVAVSRGVYLPKKQFDDCLRRLVGLRKRFPFLKRVVIAGDLKHEIGRPSSQEWNEVRKLLDWLTENFDEVVLVKGNHDNYVQNLCKQHDVVFREKFFDVKNVRVVHGHETNLTSWPKSKVLVMGHEHPSVVLSDEVGARLKLPCFLFSRSDRIVVLPAFSSLSLGADFVNTAPFGFLKDRDLSAFEVVALSESGLLSLPALGRLKDRASLLFEPA